MLAGNPGSTERPSGRTGSMLSSARKWMGGRSAGSSDANDNGRVVAVDHAAADRASDADDAKLLPDSASERDKNEIQPLKLDESAPPGSLLPESPPKRTLFPDSDHPESETPETPAAVETPKEIENDTADGPGKWVVLLGLRETTKCGMPMLAKWFASGDPFRRHGIPRGCSGRFDHSV